MGNTMTFKTKQDYTPEQMIDIMKDVAFEAGEPQLIKYALTHRIVFPALDSSNQVQVMKTGVNKWAVTRMDEAKTGALVGNSALFSIFGRLFKSRISVSHKPSLSNRPLPSLTVTSPIFFMYSHSRDNAMSHPNSQTQHALQTYQMELSRRSMLRT